MITYKEFAIREKLLEIDDYDDVVTSIDLILENCLTYSGEINESINDFISRLSPSVKAKIEFVKELASKLSMNLKNLLILFKNKYLFDFFKKMKFSVSKIVNIVKDGYKLYNDLIKLITEYMSKNKIAKFAEKNIKELDKFLLKHPLVKRSSGLVVAGLLIWIWYNMAFSGRPDSDFDNTSIFDALSGNYSLADLFSGPSGIELISLLAIGLYGISFPWPGSSAHMKFVASIIFSAAKKLKIKI